MGLLLYYYSFFNHSFFIFKFALFIKEKKDSQNCFLSRYASKLKFEVKFKCVLHLALSNILIS